MPSEREHVPVSHPDAEQTAILDAVPGTATPRGYGDRFAEDAFDYPSPQATQAWSADAPSATADEETDTASQAPTQGRARADNRARGAGTWQQVTGRHRTVLMAAAALVVLGGFGLALSSVSETVSSDPHPGGTAQVSAPRSPTAQPLPPDPAATPEPPGGAAGTTASPTQTSSSPSAGQDRGRDEKHGREEQGREDGDDADD
ncbi:hypothetical protein AB0G87_19395 [Streptomyces asoensis]|uniref:hypothetical protein n=1 Tax=Streptomyces asoensis TaxID=249586 RepID=UPI0033EE05D3